MYTCQVCPKVYKWKKDLNRHNRLSHHVAQIEKPTIVAPAAPTAAPAAPTAAPTAAPAVQSHNTQSNLTKVASKFHKINKLKLKTHNNIMLHAAAAAAAAAAAFTEQSKQQHQ